MDAHRGRSNEPTKREVPTHIATAPNQVWTWDITWLNSYIKGSFFKLYLILDMFSRFIVGYEVWETEKAEYADQLIRKAVLSQGISELHCLTLDNGIHEAELQATLKKLGILFFSRNQISNDTLFRSIFKTLNTCHIPQNGFQALKK